MSPELHRNVKTHVILTKQNDFSFYTHLFYTYTIYEFTYIKIDI